MSVKYDPLEKLDGFDITLGQITNGGDCTGGMPAVYLTRRVNTLAERPDLYPETEEEYEKYGERLPEYIEEPFDLMIGCANYQRVVAAGIAVQECVDCPLLKSDG